MFEVFVAALAVIAAALSAQLGWTIQRRRKIKARRERMTAVAKLKQANWNWSY